MSARVQGRWVRRGGRIAVFPEGGGVEGETGPIAASAAIDPRIDVHAQYALVRMSKGDAGARADAHGMLAAVKGGRLGIYKEDQQVPALRAKPLGGWWKVIPKGEDAAVFLDPARPAAELPLIVFRDGVRSNPARLDPALRKAWATFGGLGRCRIAGTAPQAEAMGMATVPANLVPPMVCVHRPPPNPAPCPRKPSPVPGLVLLDHIHRRVDAPVAPGSPSPPPRPAPMRPAGMNPGFLDLATGEARITSTLQHRLEQMLSKWPQLRGAGIAVVDLTGSKLLAPQMAGWNLTRAFEGASAAKIAAFYAVHQLRADLRSLARAHPDTLAMITDKAVLQETAREWWCREHGLSRDHQPDLDALLLIEPALPGPVRVKFSPLGTTLINCAVRTSNCNRSASVLIDRLGYPYISSVLWQSGLFHLLTGGLWLRGHYGLTADCQRVCAKHGPLNDKTTPIVPSRTLAAHNITAQSAAAFFTLLAQGRLVDPAISDEMRDTLHDACSFFDATQLSGWAGAIPTKCGYSGSLVHDSIFVERNVTGGTLRYVVTLLTSGVTSSKPEGMRIFTAFLKDADALVLANNPGLAP